MATQSPFCAPKRDSSFVLFLLDVIIHACRDDSLEPLAHSFVIQSFADNPTEALWLGHRPPELPPTILKVALRKLTQLEAASRLDELRLPPGTRLEPLKRGRAGQHSIRINDQYRVCFRWDGQNAQEVEITDYH